MPRDVAAKKIPIKNIYHMLSYAWDNLKTDDKAEKGSCEFDNIYNLLAKIYLEGLKSIVKRGIYKDYIEKQEALGVLRGKINIKESINHLTFLKNKMVCDYDDFSADHQLNRIVKATIRLLMSNTELDKSYKQSLKTYQLYFQNISDMEMSPSSFSRLRYNKNNSHYKMLIDISKLILEGLLVTEDHGRVEFLEFIRDRQLAQLYEKFVLNFYKKRLSKRYKVHAPIIKWDAMSVTEEDMTYLPIMETDIVIVDKERSIQMIIDTKFYSSTLVKSHYGSTSTIYSGNLYQIYSYIMNSSFEGEIRGMLLYPKVGRDMDVNYTIGGKQVRIKTVDLNDDWYKIEETLLGLISCYLP